MPTGQGSFSMIPWYGLIHLLTRRSLRDLSCQEYCIYSGPPSLGMNVSSRPVVITIKMFPSPESVFLKNVTVQPH